MPIVPPSRPQITLTELRQRLGGGLPDAVWLAGIRGYYRDSMGTPGQNDRGIYDDAIVLISPNAYATFNANTDPSVTRPGIAVLQPGTWTWEIGKHKRSDPKYDALLQPLDVPFTVLRDGASAPVSGIFGINCHKGGYTSTSSEGCQTIFPGQYAAFISLVYSEMKRAGLRRIRYRLGAA